jgi:two-component system sensor histidine kinase YesM
MIRYLKSMKLKKQLLLLIVISIAFMLVIEVYYYVSLSNVIKDRAKVYADNLLNQLVEQMETSNSDVKNSTDLLSFNRYVQLFMASDQAGEKLEYSKILEGITPYFVSSNDQISNIILVDKQGVKTGDHLYPLTLLDHIEKNYDLYSQSSNLDTFTDIVEDPFTGHYYYGYVKTVYWSQENTNPFDKIGTCIVQISTDTLDSFLQRLNLTKSTKFLILDDSNRIVSSNDPSYATGSVASDEVVNGIRASDSESNNFNDTDVMFQTKSISETGWKVVSMIPVSEISDELRPVQATGVFLVVLFLALSIMLGILFNRNITRPIFTLIRFLNRVELNNPAQRLYRVERNEIGELYGHINKMLDEMHSMTKQVMDSQTSLYEMKLAKKQAELSALISQINPHFLYNTLDSLKGIGYYYKSNEIVVITECLANILRYSIKGSDIVLVKDELACVRNYLSIISTRFANRFEFIWDIEEPIHGLRMTKFILQPVVENAIYHGLEPKLEMGHLHIRAFVQSGNLYFEIRDDGVGISTEKLKALTDKLGQGTALEFTDSSNREIGLLNINHRIQLLHGPEYGLHVTSVVNEGTTVRIALPVLEKGTL